MKGKRLKQTLHLYFLLNSRKRMKYIKEQHVFASIGNNCSIMDRKIPLYANLIKIGNNVHIASKVDFITHDITHVVLNGILKNDDEQGEKKNQIKEKIGCIEIGNNVFIGSNTTVLLNVKIGNNVIIGAGSLVNKDIVDNSVVAGVPARKICSFDDFVKKRVAEKTYPDTFKVANEAVNDSFAKWLWDDFYKQRDIEN